MSDKPEFQEARVSSLSDRKRSQFFHNQTYYAFQYDKNTKSCTVQGTRQRKCALTFVQPATVQLPLHRPIFPTNENIGGPSKANKSGVLPTLLALSAPPTLPLKSSNFHACSCFTSTRSRACSQQTRATNAIMHRILLHHSQYILFFLCQPTNFLNGHTHTRMRLRQLTSNTKPQVVYRT